MCVCVCVYKKAKNYYTHRKNVSERFNGIVAFCVGLFGPCMGFSANILLYFFPLLFRARSAYYSPSIILTNTIGFCDKLTVIRSSVDRNVRCSC